MSKRPSLSTTDPGSGPPSPPVAHWGDYFRTSQMMVPAIGTGVLGMPGWLNVTAFPHSAPRPVGQPSPCFVEENITSDPQHVSAIAWPQFRLF